MPATMRGMTAGRNPSGTVWMLLVFLVLAVHGLFLRDRIPVAGGFGYDGDTYGRVALQPAYIFELPFNRVQRCLPSLLVHLLMRGLHLPPTPSTVVNLFLVTNVALLLGALGLWLRIVSRLQLRPPSATFGFCGIFLSFAGATMPYYYPVLTDTWALFLGLLVVWLYLEGSFRGLLATFLLAGLVWPSLMYFMAPLLVFPIERRRLARVPPAPWTSRVALALAVACVGAAGLALRDSMWANPIEPVLPLSFVVMAAYVFVGGRELIEAGRRLGRGIRRDELPGIAARAAAVIIAYAAEQAILQSAFTKPTEYVQRPRGLLILVFETSVIAPAAFLVGHTAHFGILALAVVGLWRRVCRAAAELGPGPWLFLCATFLFSLNAESRHGNAVWPAVVVLVCLVLDRYRWPRPLLTAFCALSFLDSRAWVVFNADFPRLYFANFALAMGTFWYVVQAAAFAAVAMALSLSWRVSGVRPAPRPPV